MGTVRRDIPVFSDETTSNALMGEPLPAFEAPFKSFIIVWVSAVWMYYSWWLALGADVHTESEPAAAAVAAAAL